MSKVSPKVWSKFTVKKKDGTALNLRIVDMPKYLYDSVLNLYTYHFMRDESTFVAAGFLKNEKAFEEINEQHLFSTTDIDRLHTTICCLDNSEDEIKDVLGASTMLLVSKNEPHPELDLKTPEIQKLYEIMYGLTTQYNEMEAFDLDRSFSDRGVVVHPEYRGLGIAKELLRVRRLICKEHGIPIHGAWMTSYGTQKAAEGDGWETVYEVTSEELTKTFGVTFDNPYKFMIARIQL